MTEALKAQELCNKDKLQKMKTAFKLQLIHVKSEREEANNILKKQKHLLNNENKYDQH